MTAADHRGVRVSFFKWLGLSDSSSHASVDSLREIEKALTDLDPAEARYLACFAYILGRIARADHHVSAHESSLIERLVAERGHLAPDRAALVTRIATAEGLRHGGTEDYIVSREFAQLATRDQKLALLDCLFAVSATDESIQTIEDNEVRRVASEIKLEHGDFIARRAAVVGLLSSRKRQAPTSAGPTEVES